MPEVFAPILDAALDSAEPPHPDRGVSVGCSRCVAASLQAPELDLRAARTTAEVFGELSLVAEARGWAVVAGDGEAKFVCPACLAKSAAAASTPLAPYEASAACPKCGGSEWGVRFCDGRKAGCGLGAVRDHLHRECGACGFSRVTACRDERRKSLFKRMLSAIF